MMLAPVRDIEELVGFVEPLFPQSLFAVVFEPPGFHLDVAGRMTTGGIQIELGEVVKNRGAHGHLRVVREAAEEDQTESDEHQQNRESRR